MKRSILEIYALSVCLITLVWSIVVIGLGVYDCIKMSSPGLTIGKWEYSKYLTNENYLEHCCSHKDQPPKLAEEEVTRKRVEGMKIALDEEKRDGLQGLIKNVIALVINAIVFTAHWKLSKRAREPVGK